VNNRRVLLEF